MTDLRELLARALNEHVGHMPYHQDNFKPMADAIIAAIKANGLMIVPREPTEAMIEGGYDHVWSPHIDRREAEHCWIGMLAASPCAKEFE